MPEALLTDLKLRLDHEQEIRVGSGRCDQRGKDKGQRNEGHVSHDEAGGGRHGCGIQRAHIGPIVHLHARVGLKFPGELAVTHIDGDDGGRSPAQQNVRKATRRGSRVEGATPLNARGLLTQGIEGPGELVRAARDILGVIGGGHDDGLRGIHLARGLENDLAVEFDASLLDHGRRGRARLRQASSHQLGVNPSQLHV